MTATSTPADGLQSAFDAFNQHSSRLEESYLALSEQVEALTQKLGREQFLHHRELREKQRLGQLLLRTVELLPGAVLVLDAAGRICEQNSRAADLLSRPLLGMPWSDVVRRECVPGGRADGDLHLRDGRRLSLTRSPLGPEQGEVLLLTDVTDSRHMSELLTRRERLSALGEMTARLAHQIRTPIASALLNVARIEGDQQQRALAGRIRDRLRDVSRMVDDMLTFTAGAHGTGDRFDLINLYDELVDICAAGGDRGSVVTVVTDGPVEVAGNRDALKGALINLVENAQQAAGREGRVELGVERRGDRVCLTVTDNGPGIPPAVLARLFEPFFTTRPQGTGLGLAVVQSVADAHGGEVLVDSGNGSTTLAICLPHRESHDE